MVKYMWVTARQSSTFPASRAAEGQEEHWKEDKRHARDFRTPALIFKPSIKNVSRLLFSHCFQFTEALILSFVCWGVIYSLGDPELLATNCCESLQISVTLMSCRCLKRWDVCAQLRVVKWDLCLLLNVFRLQYALLLLHLKKGKCDFFHESMSDKFLVTLPKLPVLCFSLWERSRYIWRSSD